VHSDQHRAWRVESLVQRWCYFIRALNLEAGCTKGLGILHVIDRAKSNARGALILDCFLRSDHVIAPIDPDHMNYVGVQPYRGLKLVRRKKETSVPRYGEHLFVRADKGGGDGPGQRCSERLLAIADEELSRTKAEQIADTC
jgi:hypothetical protein